MKSNEINLEQIDRHIASLSKIGNLGTSLEDGFFRAPWSDEESQAMQYFADYAKSKGLDFCYDSVGNLFIREKNKNVKVLQVGSHLDTVPNGGLFDGGAGIIAGIEAILAANNKNYCFELVIWRAEESAVYRSLYMGSKAAFGQADAKFLENTYNSKSMREAIIAQGYSPDSIEGGWPTISQSQIDDIAAHVELHIEQAQRLEIDKLNIGIVTSIRAPRRYIVRLKGESAHSGATPMGIKYRKDTNLAICYIGVRLDQALTKRVELGADLVQTIGVLNSNKDLNQLNPEIYESAITKVASFAYFMLDIRGNKKSDLDQYTKEALDIIQNTAKEFNVDLEIEKIAESDPQEELSPYLIEKLSQAAEALNYSYTRMPSGAGHDAVVVSQQIRSDGTSIPTAMIFIPCRDGISHNPKEYANPADILKGAQLIAELFSVID